MLWLVVSEGLPAQEWYEGSTKHRKLTWISALGTCSLKANFDVRPTELILSTFQAALLLLFNNGAGAWPVFQPSSLATQDQRFFVVMLPLA